MFLHHSRTIEFINTTILRGKAFLQFGTVEWLAGQVAEDGLDSVRFFLRLGARAHERDLDGGWFGAVDGLEGPVGFGGFESAFDGGGAGGWGWWWWR